MEGLVTMVKGLMNGHVPVLLDGKGTSAIQIWMNVHQILASMEHAIKGLGQIFTTVLAMLDGVESTAMQMLMNVHLTLA